MVTKRELDGIALFAIPSILVGCLLLVAAVAAAGPQAKVGPRERCPVCGMFVAKYPNWITQVKAAGRWYFFDGVKDMMAWIFHPNQYDGVAADKLGEIWVRDYYTLEWIDGRKAFYVIGSDVYGPMGHELVPFSSRAAAVNFQKDHHGKQVLAFDDITPKLIESLRRGMRMR